MIILPALNSPPTSPPISPTVSPTVSPRDVRVAYAPLPPLSLSPSLVQSPSQVRRRSISSLFSALSNKLPSLSPTKSPGPKLFSLAPLKENLEENEVIFRFREFIAQAKKEPFGITKFLTIRDVLRLCTAAKFFYDMQLIFLRYRPDYAGALMTAIHKRKFSDLTPKMCGTLLDISSTCGIKITNLTIGEFTYNYFSFLFGFTQSIELSSCNFSSKQQVALTNFTKLSRLDLSFSLCDNGLSFLEKLTGLRELSLRGCTWLADSSAKHLAKLKVEFLDVSECDALSHDGAIDHIIQIKELRVLLLHKSKRLSSAGLMKISELSNLEKLDISSCKKLCSSPIRYLGARLSHLQELNLSNCSGMQEEGLKWLNLAGELRRLNLSGLLHVTDFVLQMVATLDNLTALDISDCPKITVQSLEPFQNHLTLTELNVSQCKKIKGEFAQLRALFSKCPLQKNRLHILARDHFDKMVQDFASLHL